MDKIKFHIVTVVWGQAYTDLFLRVALPSQLASGNLCRFCGHEVSYYIYTTDEDRQRIEDSAVFGKLRDTIESHVVNIDSLVKGGRDVHHCMSLCHREAVKKAGVEGALLIFLSPDSIFSNCSFGNLVRLAEEGKRNVMIAGIRLTKESFVSTIESKIEAGKGVSIDISAVELSRLMLENMHPISRRLCVGSDNFTRHPSHLYFPVEGEGMIARCFHLHPLLFCPHVNSGEFVSTIDGDLIEKSNSKPEDVYVVTNSDEILGCELSCHDKEFERVSKNTASPFKVALWAKESADRHHRYYLKYKIFFNAGTKTDKWARTEAESDKFVHGINGWLKLEFLFINKICGFKTPIASVTTIKRRTLTLICFLRVNIKRLLKGVGLYEFLKRQKNRILRMWAGECGSIDSVVKKLLDKAGYGDKYEFEQIKDGANNRVYKISAGNSCFLLKSYFNHKKDSRDRLGTEFAFTSFAYKYGIREIPRQVVFDRGSSAALYEFVEGGKIKSVDVCDEYIQQAVDFFCGLNTLRVKGDSIELPIASEACFSIKEHVNCVERRLGRLAGVNCMDGVGIGFKTFLYNDLLPAWGVFKDTVMKRCNSLGIRYGRSISMNERCISPSDFGFHNTILRDDGRVCFIDFEYAGWDDPAKAICDFFSQPEVPVSREYWPLFERGLGDVFGDINILKKRIDLLFGLYRIKWCCIMLNDFLLVENQRRDFAIGIDAKKRRKDQLEKSKNYFAEFYDEFKVKGTGYGLY